MGCCFLVVVACGAPRVGLVLLWLNGYLAHAYQTHLWPLLGFFLMPWTTISYAICMNQMGGVQGWGVALLILGVILDAGTHGGTTRTRRRGPRAVEED
ncbi:MAG TPA: hypothetical protein VGP72_29830 [Planctomycetota bacterium]|jgi:hypothetical protein